MKKLLSFVLVLAMVLGSVSMAFAKTETFSDVKGLACEEAVNVLAGLGVVQGYPDGEFKPARNITRAEAVKLIVGALAIPVDEKGSYETQFTDVPANEWYAGYVRYANALGITKGTSATEFSPNAMVTSDQMIAFTMRALGYNEAVLQGEYPACFINKAVGLKVLDGVSTGSQAAPRGEIAQLIYNTLLKQIGTVGADGLWHGAMIGDDTNLNGQKDDTMLNRLGAKLYNGGEYVLIDQDWIDEALVDLTSYHGAVAQLYVNDDDEVVAIGDVLTTFVTAKYDKDTEKLGDYKFSKDFDKTDSIDSFVKAEASKRTTGKSVPKNVMTIENGDENAKAETIDPITKPEKLTYAVVIQGGRIAAVYSSQKWAVSDIIKITEDDLKDLAEDEPTIADHEFPLDDDDKLDTSKFKLDGVASLDKIEEDDVVYVYTNEAGTVAKLEVSDAVVKGEFTKIRGKQKNTDDSNDEDRYYVAGTAYQLADKPKAVTRKDGGNDLPVDILTDDNLGEEYTIYLGYDGKIAFVEGEDNSSTDYVVFLEYWTPAQGNADSRKNIGKAGLSVFSTEGREELYFTKDLTKEYDKAGYDSESYEIEAGTLVKITRKANGDVSTIVAVKEGADLDKDTGFDGKAEAEVSNKGRVKYAEAALKSNSVVYNYSGKAGDADDLKDEEKYSVMQVGKLYNGDFDFAALARTDKGYVAAALISGGTNKADDIVVLTGKLHTVKDAFEADVFMNGEKKTLTVNDEADPTFDKYVAPETVEGFESLVYVIDTVNADGEVTSVSKPEMDTITLSTGSGIRVEEDVIFGADDAPYEIEDGAVFYLYDYSDDKWTVVSANTLRGLKGDEKAEFGSLKNGQGYAVRAIKTDEDHDGYDIFIICRE